MRSVACLLLLLVSALITRAQQEEEMSRKGKFFLIPELRLSVGTTTYIEVAPQVGYHLTDRLSVGLGPSYQYQSQKETPYIPFSYETHIYGMKGFARFALLTNAERYLPINLFSDLFGHVGYEALNLERKYFDAPTYPDDGRFIYHGLLVGGGISQKVGMFNSITLMILWDLNESSRSPNSNPVFRVGINIYF